MHFELDERSQTLQEAARRYAREALAPRADTFEEKERVPPEVFEDLASLGLMAVAVPAAWGGSGLHALAYAVALREIARGCASTAVTMAVTNMVGEVLARFGSEAQRRRYNPLLASGRPGAFALSEPEAGSDPASMRTTAVRDGDGWVIEGTKQWISHADQAAVMVLWARTGEPGARGISCFLVEPDAPGLRIDKLEDKMGLRASHTCALTLEEVRVPDSARLGSLGEGFKIAMMALDGGRIGIGSQACGIGEAALERAVAWASAHPARARSQAVQWALADASTRLEAAWLMTLRAATLKRDGRPFTREASEAKVFSSEAAWHATTSLCEVMGPEGLAPATGVERMVRDSRVTRIYEGTSEIQRVVIARRLLAQSG